MFLTLQVALQFPDSLLVDAPSVAREIEHRLPDASVFILGDTSYGRCSIYELSHHTCLSFIGFAFYVESLAGSVAQSVEGRAFHLWVPNSSATSAAWSV